MCWIKKNVWGGPCSVIFTILLLYMNWQISIQDNCQLWQHGSFLRTPSVVELSTYGTEKVRTMSLEGDPVNIQVRMLYL